jgi:glutamine amidotransferase
MIGIVDYGMGNVGSVESMINFLGYHKTQIIKSPEELNLVDKLILPGVGSFDNGMGNIIHSGWLKELHHHVIEKHKPILGICLGMQLLMEKSEEGTLSGLGFIKGECKKFNFKDTKLKVPHMGWNQVKPIKSDLCEKDSRFYFVHSYYVECKNKEDIMLETEYGIKFTSGVSKDNIFGVQFHPEKSHKYGMKLMEKFITC